MLTHNTHTYTHKHLHILQRIEAATVTRTAKIIVHEVAASFGWATDLSYVRMLFELFPATTNAEFLYFVSPTEYVRSLLFLPSCTFLFCAYNQVPATTNAKVPSTSSPAQRMSFLSLCFCLCLAALFGTTRAYF